MRHLHSVSRSIPATAGAVLPPDYKPGIIGVFQRAWVEAKGIVF